jgi:hypothetical protein
MFRLILFLNDDNLFSKQTAKIALKTKLLNPKAERGGVFMLKFLKKRL